MYNKLIRPAPYLINLRQFISREYAIHSTAIEPARRGYFGETWKLISDSGAYFLKLDYSPHQTLYAGSFHVMDHIRHHGVARVSEIIPASGGELFTRYDGAVLGVFRWIDGENMEDEASRLALYNILANVYRVPTDSLTIRREDFKPHSAKLYRRLRDRLAADDHPASSRALGVLDAHADLFDHRERRLEHFANICQRDCQPLYITHGDAGGNTLLCKDGYTLIDWDDPILAPPERDIWFGLTIPNAVDEFNRTLYDAGISYKIQPARLAFYCYYSFFLYLTEYLDAYFALRDVGQDWAETLATYFTCWVEEEVRQADMI